MVVHFREPGKPLTACGRIKVKQAAGSWLKVSCPDCLKRRG